MVGIGLSSQAYNSWACAALSWALLGAPNGEAVSAGIQPAGGACGPKPVCQAQTHFADSCLLNQHRDSESVETRKLHSVERLGACLVFQKLLGMLAGCPSSGPPHLPTPVSGASAQVPSRAPSPLGASASASPVLAEARQFHGEREGSAAPGAQ